MTTPVEAFDDHLDAWKRGQAEPWMRLRYELAQSFLQRHLPPPPAHILDVGGGNGYEALPLARAGYHVTILDYSAAMLEDARALAQSLGVTDRVTLIHGSLETLAAQIPASSADVALCHNVLQYVERPPRYLDTIASRLAAGGLLSIINPNAASEALRLACQEYDVAGAAAALDRTERHVPTFGVSARRHTADQLTAWLASAGLSLVAHYGIRCVCDILADNARKYDAAFYAELRTLELAMGTRDPYRQIARFMHLIARKPAAE